MAFLSRPKRALKFFRKISAWTQSSNSKVKALELMGIMEDDRILKIKSLSAKEAEKKFNELKKAREMIRQEQYSFFGPRMKWFDLNTRKILVALALKGGDGSLPKTQNLLARVRDNYCGDIEAKDANQKLYNTEHLRKEIEYVCFLWDTPIPSGLFPQTSTVASLKQ